MFEKFRHFSLQIFRNHYLSQFESDTLNIIIHFFKLNFLSLFLSNQLPSAINSISNQTSYYQMHTNLLSKYHKIILPKCDWISIHFRY